SANAHVRTTWQGFRERVFHKGLVDGRCEAGGGFTRRLRGRVLRKAHVGERESDGASQKSLCEPHHADLLTSSPRARRSRPGPSAPAGRTSGGTAPEGGGPRGGSRTPKYFEKCPGRAFVESEASKGGSRAGCLRCKSLA